MQSISVAPVMSVSVYCHTVAACYQQMLQNLQGASWNSLMVVQVCMHTCAELIASVPFLEDAEDDFVRYLVTQLHPTV